MNYRHAYHAGNFADVLKHTVLARVIEYMKRKDAPFRVIDVHAGAGRYALDSARPARRVNGRPASAASSGPTHCLYRRTWNSICNPICRLCAGRIAGGRLDVYPGSPAIALQLMRAQDTLIANELHPEELAHLKAAVGADRRAKVMALDAWVALKSLLPPKERRGIVLIDPPFEEAGELDRMVDGPSAGPGAVRHRRLSGLVSYQGPEADRPISRRLGRARGARAHACRAPDPAPQRS